MSRFLNLLKPGATVFDVGANIGYYTLTAAARIGAQGRVFALEPNPTAATRLRENVGLNKLRNVEVIEAAASDAPGAMKFHLGEDSEGSSLFDCVLDGVGATTVAVTTIDAVINRLGVHRVDLIKMDVEGAEIAALRGARRLLTGPDAPPLFLEANPATLQAAGASLEELRRFLGSLGYQVSVIEKLPWQGSFTENWLAVRT